MRTGRRGAPEVAIRFGTLPAGLPGAHAQGPSFQVGNGDFLLDVPKVARYRIRDGKEIMIDPQPEGSARNVRLFLLGSAFGVLCHQRGLLPLHANAIVVNGTAIAFAGHAGVGKSTLAAQFHASGHGVLGDDICVLSFDAMGRPWAWPGLPRLKLWRDAAERFGHDCDTLERIVDGQEKYHVPLQRAVTGGPFPLARIYVLGDDPTAPRGAITRLAGANALDALMTHTYRSEYLLPMRLMQRHFGQSLAVLNHAQIHAAPCHRGCDLLEAEAAKLECHFLESDPRTEGVSSSHDVGMTRDSIDGHSGAARSGRPAMGNPAANPE